MRRNTTGGSINDDSHSPHNQGTQQQLHRQQYDVSTSLKKPINRPKFSTIRSGGNGYFTNRKDRNGNSNSNSTTTLVGIVSCCVIVILLYALRDNPIEQRAIESIEQSKFVQDVEGEIVYLEQQMKLHMQRQLNPPKLSHDGHDELKHDIITTTTTTKTDNSSTNDTKVEQGQSMTIIQGTGDKPQVVITKDDNPIKSVPVRLTKDGRTIPDYQLDEIITEFQLDEESYHTRPVARGVSGRPITETPALINAKRAHIECDINVDSLAYWNDNPNDKVTTFHVTNQDEYYISFSPDHGGWNNIRMCMEIIFLLAAVTGRTLVLPPKAPLYLLHLDKKNANRGFADFFPINTLQFQSQVKVISFSEFLQRVESNTDINNNNNPFHVTNDTQRQELYASSDHCGNDPKSKLPCTVVFDYLESHASNSNISYIDTCVIFDETVYNTGSNETMSLDNIDYVTNVCGTKRQPYYWTKSYNQDNKLIHFRAGHKLYRLLAHFYNTIFFTNPIHSNYYKRFVRDYLHYQDPIYCAAGKIVQAIQYEGVQRNKHYKQVTGKNSTVGIRDSNEGDGGYVAFHVRRGDLQYKKVKISAESWYENTKALIKPGELLYIATDERNKTWFDPIRKHHEIRFLDDYWDLGQLSTLDPNYIGMIDTIIASRGRIFVGTFFSTFTGYINRLRGYHGMSMKLSYYSWMPRFNHTHEWKLINDPIFAYEWCDGWVGIDADTYPTRDVF